MAIGRFEPVRLNGNDGKQLILGLKNSNTLPIADDFRYQFLSVGVPSDRTAT